MNTQKKATAATVANEVDCSKYEQLHINLCSGFGQYHTNNPFRSKRKPYETITLAQIADMAATPPSVAKETGQWLVSTDYTGEYARDSEYLRQNAQHHAALIDLDKNPELTFTEKVEALSSVLPFAFIAWTSRSATEKNQKAHIILPYDHAIASADHELIMQIIHDKLATIGVIADRKMETGNQIYYLPNKGEYWDHAVNLEAPFLSADDLAEDLRLKLQAKEAEEQARIEQLEQSRQRANERLKTDMKSPIDAARAEYREVDLLKQYGGKAKGDRACSPLSESGNYQIQIKPDGKLLSHHGSDMEAGLGKLTNGGKARLIDSFDLIKFFEYGNDETAALKGLGERFTDEHGVSITEQNQRIFMANLSASPEAIAAVQAMFEPVEEQGEVPEPPSPAGVDLLTPPGLAGDICRLMQLKARRERPELYPFAALHLMALIGRKRSSVYTSKLNLITLGIAETAAGKETAQNELKLLANMFHAAGKIHGDSGSFKDMIYNLIEGDGASLYIVDEIHSLLGSMRSDNAQTYETKMEREILVMSSTELYTFRGLEKRQLLNAYQKDQDSLEKKLEAEPDDEQRQKLEFHLERVKRVIEYLNNGWPSPFFSIMGHSVPDRLDSFASPENIASGFIGRTLIMRCPERREKLRRKRPDAAEVSRLMGAIEWGITSLQAGNGMVDVTPEAEDYLNECVDWYDDDDQLNHSLVGGVYARAPEQLFKVASILGLDGGTITLEHAKYAHALVKQSVADVQYLMLKAMANTGSASEIMVKQHAKQTILRNSKGAGIQPSALKQIVTKPKQWQELQDKAKGRDLYQELVDHLLQTGELELVQDGRRQRYKTNKAA